MKKLSKNILLISLFSISLSACSLLPSPNKNKQSKEESFENNSSNIKENSSHFEDEYEPVYDKNSNTVTYGIYPQTAVEDSAIIQALNNISDSEPCGYVYYNGNYYYSVTTNHNNFSKLEYCFMSGTRIQSNTNYWFKCDPIVWNVLNKTGNEFYLLSSTLLDVSRYDKTTTKYAQSSIREWLNLDFYNKAFFLNDSHVVEDWIDNSAGGDNASEDTLDKVFLPSLEDYLNPRYGFANETSNSAYEPRCCLTTDYTRAKGAMLAYAIYSNGNNGYTSLMRDNGFYWTRTPRNSSSVEAILGNGGVWNDGIDIDDDCARPAIRISL